MKRLLFVVALLAACAPNPAPVTAPAPSTTTTTTTKSPNALTPAGSVIKTIIPPHIRVGMLSDQSTVSFPRVDGGYFLIDANGSASTLRRGFTATAPLANAVVHYAVQVSTMSDVPSMTAFTDKLRTETGQQVDAVFDPAAGTYRVIAGDFPDAASAEPFRGQLTQSGYGKEMLIVRRPAAQQFTKAIDVVDDEGDRTTIAGESLLILPATQDTITIDKQPVRTAARLFVNSRGLINVINELNLEDYLRGVVPGEMGPKVFDELEALKAQAIAARTYAVRNLGQYGREGYDICPGPACQQYLGFKGEDAMSDRAVKETAGLIATYDGKPIDALYTATCGGETSDVATMFPGRNEPYLKRARCVELDMTALAGRADSGEMNETQVNARLFAAVAGVPEPQAWSARDVEQAVSAATSLLKFQGVTVAPLSTAAPVVASAANPAAPATTLASSRRGDVLVYLAKTFGFDSDAAVLTLPEDRKYFFPQTQYPEATAYRAAAFLVKFGFLPAQAIDRIDLHAAMPRDELYSLLGSWLKKHGSMAESNGKIAAIAGRKVSLKAEGKTTSFTLPDGIPIFRRVVDRYQEYRSVPVMIGDRATIELDGRKHPVAMIVQANYDGASFDRTSSFANWTRSYRNDELVTSINKRNAIKELHGLRPLGADASGRITALEVTAENGRTFILKGLPIRWSLGVPDNLFVFDKTADSDGVDRYTFYGKGWGHGVGLCQVGAYGMAFRGFNAQQILTRFYSGIQIVPMSP